MKISDFEELKSKFRAPSSERDYIEILDYLTSRGINISSLYQELEMSAKFVNMHKDITSRKMNISLHSHSFYEVIFCRASDRVEYLVGSKRYKLIAGDAVIVAPGVSHRPIFPEDMQYPYDRDILWMKTDFLKRVSELFPSSEIGKGVDVALLRTKGTRFEYIGDYFSAGITEANNKEPGSDETTAALALLIMTHVFRAMGEESAPLKEEKPTLINSIIEYVEENLERKITLDTVAEQFFVSRSTVSKEFRSRLDTTFYSFVTQRRLIYAKTLIGEGERLELVGLKCGFSDYSTFFKAFKKEYGISPREFSRIKEP